MNSTPMLRSFGTPGFLNTRHPDHSYQLGTFMRKINMVPVPHLSVTIFGEGLQFKTQWEMRTDRAPQWIRTGIDFMHAAGPGVQLDIDGPCIWHGAGYYWFYDRSHVWQK